MDFLSFFSSPLHRSFQAPEVAECTLHPSLCVHVHMCTCPAALPLGLMSCFLED